MGAKSLSNTSVKLKKIFLNLPDNINIGLVICDKNLNIIYWNKKTEQHFNIKADEVVGRNIIKRFPHLKFIGLEEALKSAIRFKRKIILRDVKEKTTRVGVKYVDYIIDPILDKKKELLGVSILNTDVSRRNIYKNRLLYSKETFSILYNTSRTMLSTLNEDIAIFQFLTALLTDKRLNINRVSIFKYDDITHSLNGYLGIDENIKRKYGKIWSEFFQGRIAQGTYRKTLDKIQGSKELEFNNIIKDVVFFERDTDNPFISCIKSGNYILSQKTNLIKVPGDSRIKLRPKNSVLLPVIWNSNIFGVVMIEKEKKIVKRDIEELYTFLNLLKISLERIRYHQETFKWSITDYLTHLYNHRRFYYLLKAEFSRAKKDNRSLSLLMMDLDDFKYYNDCHGHPKGDKLLKSVAKIINNNIRNIDIPARYGGEEFAIILPETDRKSALIVAERIRKEIENSKFNYEIKEDKIIRGKVTVSIGIATICKKIKNHNQFVEMADNALYNAKRKGKNQIQ